MRKTKKEPVIITIKKKGQLLKFRVPLWKAYVVMSMIEKEEFDLQNKKKDI